MKTWLRYLLLIAGAVLVACLGFETYFRIDLYNKIEERAMRGGSVWIQGHTLTPAPFDQLLGRKPEMHPKGLFKVNTTFDLSIVQADRSRINFSVRSNNIGLLSDNQYTLERDRQKPEYRIVVLGDSFTGPTTATYMWVDTVDHLLNDNTALRAAVGNRTFRVYNLGIIGAGFARFWDAFDKSGRHFSPDLVIVNYLSLDLPRGRRAHLKTEGEMLAEARRHVDKLAAETKGNLLLTLMPSFEELMGTKAQPDLGKRLDETDPRFKVVVMRAHMPADAGEREIKSWFNYPFDAHYSDRGGEIYARAMAAVIAERVAGLTIDFSRAPSRYGDEVLFRSEAPMTRPIRNSLSRLADDGDAVVNLRRNIYIEERAKALALYPVGLAAAFGLGTDGLTTDLTRPRTQAFQQIRFGPGPDDTAFLILSCLSRPHDLSNPDCWHAFHVFMKGDDE